MKKKIAFVSVVDWPFVSHRLPLAIQLIEEGYEVCLFTKNTGKFIELQKLGIKCFDFEIKRSKINLFYELKLIIKLRLLLKSYKPDILYLITLKPILYGSLVDFFKFKKYIKIYAVTGLGYVFMNKKVFFKRFIIKMIFKFLLNSKNSFFVFQNNDDKSTIGKYVNIENKHVLVKGVGVDHKIFKIDSERNNNKINILFPARMVKDKGFYEYVLAAQKLLIKYKGKIRFYLAGGIDNESACGISEKEVFKYCDQKSIIWLNHQSNMKKTLLNIDIVCLPSYGEGLPKALVEGMAMSCAIIATDVPGCRECVNDGFNGFLVKPQNFLDLANKLEILINDKPLIKKMGSNSRKLFLDQMTQKKSITSNINFINKIYYDTRK